jgi:hypothetical protein
LAAVAELEEESLTVTTILIPAMTLALLTAVDAGKTICHPLYWPGRHE